MIRGRILSNLVNWIDAWQRPFDAVVLPVIAACPSRPASAGAGWGDHAAAAALVTGFGPEWKAAWNRALAFANWAILKLDVNFTFTWHARSLFQLSNLAL